MNDTSAAISGHSADASAQGGHAKSSLATLSIAALGVVYGDIGTSPLYAMRECFHGKHAIGAEQANVLGVLSLIVWSLILVVSVKYLAYVLRADHGGEGGILALTALAVPNREKKASRGRKLLVLIGLFGAALLYGDSMITPAVSVLSATEGLEVIAPSLQRFVLPVTIVILVILFSVQKKGTRGVGAVFGPVMVVWFVSLAAIGLNQILRSPDVLAALSPVWGVKFLVHNGFKAFIVLGSVLLAITGAESIYADLGHFGKKPIRLMWFSLVLPCLVLNYFGQGAVALRNPEAIEDLFFRTAPSWSLVPLVILTTAATIIASQAVISSAFSISRQAVMMGFLPRLKIEHTSAREIGQIYVPAVNWVIMVAAVAFVLGFKSSSALAGAYGICVTSTMCITTTLAWRVYQRRFGWPLALSTAVTLLFATVDLSFLGANMVKIADGGYVPLLVAAAILVLMTTWRAGRDLLSSRTAERTVSLSKLMADVRADKNDLVETRVDGTAVYMCSTPDIVPLALMYTLKHHHVLHERVIILTVITDDAPHVDLTERAWVEPLGKGVWRVTGVYGFMEDPDVPDLLRYISTLNPELNVDVKEATFFLGQETILASDRPGGMLRWREHLFAAMARNSAKATRFFGLPPERVVEVGAYIEM